MHAPTDWSPSDPAPRPRRGDGTPPAELLEQVAARLRPVCGDMGAEHFDALVLDVARFTMRWGETRRPPP